MIKQIFTGIIDLIIQTNHDQKYHIIDLKTCGWGWKAEKKASTEVNYQLIYYKHFFAEIVQADPNDIETHFCLLKRTAKGKTFKDRVEIFRITSGPKKIKNALIVLNECVINANKKKFVKNKLNCIYCEYARTEYCDGLNKLRIR